MLLSSKWCCFYLEASVNNFHLGVLVLSFFSILAYLISLESLGLLHLYVSSKFVIYLLRYNFLPFIPIMVYQLNVLCFLGAFSLDSNDIASTSI